AEAHPGFVQRAGCFVAFRGAGMVQSAPRGGSGVHLNFACAASRKLMSTRSSYFDSGMSEPLRYQTLPPRSKEALSIRPSYSQVALSNPISALTATGSTPE